MGILTPEETPFDDCPKVFHALHVWNTGQTTSLRSYWKVKQYDHIIGAYEGKETQWTVVKESQGVIHSHPISEEKAKRYIK
ncbi:hypothetical protein LNY74_05780 [Klebsiella pneumoniae]|nr:hypothetical protein [Klebsiella pneumoniae]MTW92438.1 hypothetical protein [Klebsiella pneumoniae]